MSYNKSFCKDIYLISDIKLNPKPPETTKQQQMLSLYSVLHQKAN